MLQKPYNSKNSFLLFRIYIYSKNGIQKNVAGCMKKNSIIIIIIIKNW